MADPNYGDLNVRGVPRGLIQRLKVEAIRRGLTLSELMVLVMSDWCHGHAANVSWIKADSISGMPVVKELGKLAAMDKRTSAQKSPSKTVKASKGRRKNLTA